MLLKIITLICFIGLFSLNLLGQGYERYKKLIDTTLTSENLGFDKNITITVPIEWQKDIDSDFPLIIVFDQQNQRSHNYILNTIDYLTSNEQMPSSVIVSIESTDEYRTLETLHKESSEKGLAKENEKFLFEELIPMVEKKFKASSFRIFVGHSRYGYFATSLLAGRPNELNAVIAISPLFTQKNVNLVDSIGSLRKQDFDYHKYFRFGVGGDFPKDYHQMDSLISESSIENFNVKGFLFPEADHNVTPGLMIGTSLYEIFTEWSKNQNKYLDNNFDLAIIDSLENETVAFYGQRLKLSLGAMNGKGWFFYGEEQYGNAIKAWELFLKSYPNYSVAYLQIIKAKIMLKEDYSQTIEKLKASLISSHFFSEEEEKEIMAELKEMTK